MVTPSFRRDNEIKRRRMGTVVFTHRRQRREYGLPRNKCASCMVDADVMRVILREAERRGVTRGVLLGNLIETIVEDDMWEAILE